MEVHYDIGAMPILENAVLTIGSFDGVHRGHQAILFRLNEYARAIGGCSVLVTFHPHPRHIVSGDEPVLLLTTLEEKIALLEEFGLEHLVVMPFTKEFAEQSAYRYIEDFLVARFRPSYIVIGYDHRFGSGRAGDIGLLRAYESHFGYRVVEITEQEVNHITVSSTKVRQALERGDVTTAGQLLGYDYRLHGHVVHGLRVGRTLGYPTANIAITGAYKLVPADGIYAVRLALLGGMYDGMLYIGKRPTLAGGLDRSIEVNIFDFEDDIYGAYVELELVAYLRGDVTFTSMDALREQLALDKQAAMEVLA
jgi:riboflavin kinase/FMN adenylyltransferase